MDATRRLFVSVIAVTVLSIAAMAETSGTTKDDASIQARVTETLAAKKAFRNVRTTVEDGIVTLSGNVALYEQKLDATKKVRKLANVQGVHNLIEVAGKEVADADLSAQLNRMLYYDRIGYDNLFSFVTASVENGVATLNGETRTAYDRDSARVLVNDTPGVKDVVDNIKVAPTSLFDDRIRIDAARLIYRDPVLSRYAIDPARPIRIVVDHGTLSLYGTVANSMEKQVAGMRARQVFGAFSVQNNLEVVKKG